MPPGTPAAVGDVLLVGVVLPEDIEEGSALREEGERPGAIAAAGTTEST